MNAITRLILKLRPAPLAAFVARIFGLTRRRLVPTDWGVFFLSPVSRLGVALQAAEYEPETTAVLRRYLKPGSVFMDLGANEGYFAVVASRITGDAGTVIAIEPQSRLQSVIQENLTANDCSNVRLFQCVVAEKTGTMRLSLAAETNNGTSSLFRQTRYTLPTEEVPSFSLGDFIAKAQISGCDLVKVDIEGAEYDVFMGAGEVLRRGILRHIALETHDAILLSRGLSPQTIHEHMVACGYQRNREPGPAVYSFGGGK